MEDDDGWTDIGSAAARVVMGVASEARSSVNAGAIGAQRVDRRGSEPNADVHVHCRISPPSVSAARHSGTAAGTERGTLAGGGPTSAALAGTGETRRAGHATGGGAGNVIFVNFGGTGAAARGPYMPPRHCTIDTVTDGRVAPSRITPATGGLGNALRAKR